jgi:acetyl-CoA carboxylase carboxyltransferase component
VPLIGLNDSAGARIQEGLSVTTAIGKIFFENSIASGCIPQISAIMGPCIGVGSYGPALTDFILMVQNSSQMFITGPAVIKEVLGETVTMEELGGAKIHSEVSGVTDLVAKNDEECLAMIRRFSVSCRRALSRPHRISPVKTIPIGGSMCLRKSSPKMRGARITFFR